MAISALPARIPAFRPVAGRRRHVGLRAPGRWAGLAAALLSGASLVAHVQMVATGDHGLVIGVGLAIMALACAGCAGHAVLRPGCRRSLALVGMSIGMALLHAVMVLGPPGGTGMHAMHDGGARMAGAGPAAGDNLMLGIVGLELAVAWLAGLAVRCRRTAPGGTGGGWAVRGRMPT